jgi:microcystin-dependent protein
MSETTIRVAQLNEIGANSNINEIIVNSRQSINDSGVTKKIQLCNFLTNNIIESRHIAQSNIGSRELADLSVSKDNIINNTITCNEIAPLTINNTLMADNAINSRNFCKNDQYNAESFIASNTIGSNNTITQCLNVATGTVSINGIPYDFPTTEQPNRFLKTDGAGKLSWDIAAPGNNASLTFNEILPVGAIIPWVSNVLPADGKWLDCNGGTFVGSVYPELRDLLDQSYTPDTENFDGVNYYLPDLQCRAVVGSGTGSDGTDSETFTLNQKKGTFKHILSKEEIQHRHITGSFSSDSNDDWYPYIGSNSGILYDSFTYNSRWIAGEGNRTNYANRTPNSKAKQTQTMDLYDNKMVTSTGHNNIQPSIGLRYIIKAVPDDIVQFSATIGKGLSAIDSSFNNTSTLDLSSKGLAVKLDENDLTFDGSDRIKLQSDQDFNKITFSDTSVLTSANIGWQFAGGSGNNIPLVYSGTPDYMYDNNSPFTEIDLAPFMGGHRRRAMVRLLVGNASAGTNVFFRPKGAYANIPGLVGYSAGNAAGWGTTSVTAGVNKMRGQVETTLGGIAQVMTDAEGKVEVSNWNQKKIDVFLESYQFFTDTEV